MAGWGAAGVWCAGAVPANPAAGRVGGPQDGGRGRVAAQGASRTPKGGGRRGTTGVCGRPACSCSGLDLGSRPWLTRHQTDADHQVPAAIAVRPGLRAPGAWSREPGGAAEQVDTVCSHSTADYRGIRVRRTCLPAVLAAVVAAAVAGCALSGDEPTSASPSPAVTRARRPSPTCPGRRSGRCPPPRRRRRSWPRSGRGSRPWPAAGTRGDRQRRDARLPRRPAQPGHRAARGERAGDRAAPYPAAVRAERDRSRRGGRPGDPDPGRDDPVRPLPAAAGLIPARRR